MQRSNSSIGTEVTQEVRSWEPSVVDRVSEFFNLRLDRRDPIMLAESLRKGVSYATVVSKYAAHPESNLERTLKDAGHGALQIAGDALHYGGSASHLPLVAQAGSWLQFAADRLDVANPGFIDQFVRSLGAVGATMLLTRGAGTGVGLSTKTASLVDSGLAGAIGAGAAANQVYDQLLKDDLTRDSALLIANKAFLENLALMSLTYYLGLFNHLPLPKDRFTTGMLYQGMAAGGQTSIYNAHVGKDMLSNVPESFLLGMMVGGSIGAGRAMMRAQVLDNIRTKTSRVGKDEQSVSSRDHYDAEISNSGHLTERAQGFITEFERYVAKNPFPRMSKPPDALMEKAAELSVTDIASIPQNANAQVISYFCPRSYEVFGYEHNMEAIPLRVKQQLEIAKRFDAMLGLPDEYVRWQNHKDRQVERLASEDPLLKEIESETTHSQLRKQQYVDRLTQLMSDVYGFEMPRTTIDPILQQFGAGGSAKMRFYDSVVRVNPMLAQDPRVVIPAIRKVTKHENHHILQDSIVRKASRPSYTGLSINELPPSVVTDVAKRFKASGLVNRVRRFVYHSDTRGGSSKELMENNLRERNAEERAKSGETTPTTRKVTKDEIVLVDQRTRHLDVYSERVYRDLGLELGNDHPAPEALKILANSLRDVNDAYRFVGKGQHNSEAVTPQDFGGGSGDFIEATRTYLNKGIIKGQSWYHTASPESQQKFDALVARGHIEPMEMWELLHDDYIQTSIALTLQNWSYWESSRGSTRRKTR